MELLLEPEYETEVDEDDELDEVVVELVVDEDVVDELVVDDEEVVELVEVQEVELLVVELVLDEYDSLLEDVVVELELLPE